MFMVRKHKRPVSIHGKRLRPFAYTKAEKKLPLSVHRKFERCVLRVKQRLPKKCAVLGYPGLEARIKGCYNPFSICRTSVYKPAILRMKRKSRR